MRAGLAALGSLLLAGCAAAMAPAAQQTAVDAVRQYPGGDGVWLATVTVTFTNRSGGAVGFRPCAPFVLERRTLAGWQPYWTPEPQPCGEESDERIAAGARRTWAVLLALPDGPPPPGEYRLDFHYIRHTRERQRLLPLAARATRPFTFDGYGRLAARRP